ncbi:polysaccharide deacetylase family protein [Rhizobium helianthi]|uniref:Chitooligosaccharide deacetylase n=1 Tax=Rhizobium helianthi TaxID=1132695 RepID=A0ABW4M7Q2_9HYPH
MSAVLDALWRRRVKRGLIASGLQTAELMSKLGVMAGARGLGAIFTLHHVRPYQQQEADPNRHLEITPEFLETAICQLAADGYEFLPLEEVPNRLSQSAPRPFACFTLDDGYKNNRDHALPVFERHAVPFTIFATKGFAQRTHTIWWETVAKLLNSIDRMEFDFGQGPEQLDLRGELNKVEAFDRFARFVEQGNEAERVAALDNAVQGLGMEPLDITAALTMGERELVELAQHPLVSLGAHTVSHPALRRLSHSDALQEMEQSIEWLSGITGKRPQTFAYPYGNAISVSQREEQIAMELGISVAVTTQPGTLCVSTQNRMAALPRISLNGYYQKPHYVAALASGIPFSLMRS